MVAIVTGNSLGLSLGSLATLGQRGVTGNATQGRMGEEAYVNAGTGNLVLQHLDDSWAARGLNVETLRTYNSQGRFTDDNADNWSLGFYTSQLSLNGTANAGGSSIVRTGRDGAQSVYRLDYALKTYICTEGSGAYDTIEYVSSTGGYLWTDGSTGATEGYDSAGRLASTSDASGNTLQYTYNGASGLVESIVSPNGERHTYYDYSGTQLTQLRTVGTNGANFVRVRYEYDGNRLSAVKVDLTPEDGSISDNNTYVTRYTYDGTSNRVATITQGHGTGPTIDSLAIEYVQVGADWRVKVLRDAFGNATTFDYDTANRRTSVSNAIGTTVYGYDTVGRLVQVTTPAVAGLSASTSFVYNGNGDVTQIVDGEGRWVQMSYDSSGNAVRQWDSAGNTVARSFNTKNQLLSETSASPGAPVLNAASTRYVYDAAGKNQLRFGITAEGRVTEYRYNSWGQRSSTIQYTDAKYDLFGLAWNSAPVESSVAIWVNGLDRSKAQREDFAYDTQGRLQQSKQYAVLDAVGNGVEDAQYALKTYVYDPYGRLTTVYAPTGAGTGQTDYTYDGLGRVLTTYDPLRQLAVNIYDDVNNRTQVKVANNGLVTTSSFDKASRLISVLQSSPAGANLGETKYFYDAQNRLRMTQDAVGARHWYLYDEADRKVAEVNALGQLTEYKYNRNNQLTQTITYANATNTAALIDASGNPTDAILVNVRPAASATSLFPDRKTWRVYDNANRLILTVGELSEVTAFSYDSQSRLTDTRRYTNPFITSGLSSTPTLTDFNQYNFYARTTDQIERKFYDGDGLLNATLDSIGALTEFKYDAAGRLIEKTLRANLAKPEYIGNGTLAQLRPAISATLDATTRYFYDAKGLQVATLDPLGYLTENTYDASQNTLKTLRYATKSSQPTSSNLSNARTGAGAAQEYETYSYDALNRVLTRALDKNGANLRTTYFYDDANRQLTVTDPANVRTLTTYDLKGQVKNIVVSAATLTTSTGQTVDNGGRILSITDANGTVTRYTYDDLARKTSQIVDDGAGRLNLKTTYEYDTQGNLARVTEPSGAQTRYLYDAGGHLLASLDPMSSQVRNTYDKFGNLVTSTRYALPPTSIQTTDVGNGLIRSSWTTQTSTQDQWTRFIYDAAGQKRFEIDPVGSLTEFQYDGAGRVIATLTFGRPASGIWATTYESLLAVTHGAALPALPDSGNAPSSAPIAAPATITNSNTIIVSRDARNTFVGGVEPMIYIFKPEAQYLGEDGVPALIENFRPGIDKIVLSQFFAGGNNGLPGVYNYASGTAPILTFFGYGGETTLTYESGSDPDVSRWELLVTLKGVSASDMVMGRDIVWDDLTQRSFTSESDPFPPTHDFASGLQGFTGNAAVWSNGSNGRLVLNTPTQVGTWNASKSASNQKPGQGIKLEVTPSALSNDAFVGLSSTAGVGSTLRLGFVQGNAVYVYKDTNTPVYLGNYTPGTKYIVQIATTASGGASIFLYASGTSREQGLRSDFASGTFGWTQFLTEFNTRRNASNTGTANTPVFIDNLREGYQSQSVRSFSTGLDGITGTAASWDGAGGLVLQEATGWTYARSPETLARGRGSKFDFKATTYLQNTSIGLEQSSGATQPSRLKLVFNARGEVWVDAAGPEGSRPTQLIGYYSPGTDYTAEFLTNPNGDGTVLFYAKGQDRYSGLRYDVMGQQWGIFFTQFTTNALTAAAGGVALIDNLVEGDLVPAKPLPAVTRSFNSGLEGVSGANVAWQYGWLNINAPSAVSAWATSRSPEILTPGQSVQLQVHPEALLSDFSVSLEQNVGGATNSRLKLIFSPAGTVWVEKMGNSGTTIIPIGKYKVGAFYTAEFVTTATGGATVRLIEKYAGDNGLRYDVPSGEFSWVNFFTQFTTTRYASTTGNPTVTIDNLVEGTLPTYGVAAMSLATPAGPVAAASAPGVSALVPVVATRFVYDTAGRLTYKVDPTGYTTEYKYDGFARLVDTLDYETQLYSTSLVGGQLFDVLKASYTNNVNAGKRRTHHIYDNADRKIADVDATGAITQYLYDAGGRTITERRYARLAPATYTDADLISQLPAWADSARDRLTNFAYDALGRVSYIGDTLGGVVRNRYDAAGKVLESIRYGKRYSGAFDDGSLNSFYGNSINQTSTDRSTRTVYDALGRERFVIDALGGVTEQQYDKFGQVARTIAFDTTVSRSAVNDYSTENDVRGLLPTSTLNAHEALYTRDADGRLVHTAVAQRTSGGSKYFAVTEQQYNALDQVIKTVAYSTVVALQDLAGVVTVSQVADRLPPVNGVADRTQQFVYDLNGRVSQAIDGEGYSEYFSYGARGNKTQYINKNGATTDYVYDAAGHLTEERSAAVEVYGVDAGLNVTLNQGSTQRVITRYGYNSFGELANRTEAFGVTGQTRTTYYEYDALGRQVATTFSAVAVYDAATDTTSAPLTLSTRTVYDTFGQAVASRDVSGKYSYKTYDLLGRLVNEVDANHNATRHFYSDLVGQFSGITRLDATASFADGVGTSADAINAAVTAVAGNGTPRSMASYFDQLGRVTTSYDKYSLQDKSGAAYSFDGTLGVGGNWVASVGYQYDAFGGLVRRTELLDGAQSRQALTQYGYDLQGQLIRQLDAQGYVTDHRKNAFGEDDRVTQYASAINPDGDLWAAPAALSAQAGSALGYDRVTVFGYDRRGQQTLQSQQGLRIGRTSGTNGAVSVDGHLDNRVTYDGAGNVTATTSTFVADDGSFTQAGNSLSTTYDKLGRATKLVDALGRTTTTQYDALGNTLQTTRHANLNPGGEQAPAASGDDQLTRQRFDALGHVLQRRDALGNDTNFAYDAAGHVGKQWTPYRDVDGASRTAVQRFTYDAAGRQLGTLTLMKVGANETYSADTAVYNAFGEITAKLRDGVQYAYYDYDVAGRVWRTNADDGVDKVYTYDLQGNVSSTITSPTLNLKSAAYTSAGTVPTTLATGVRRTVNKVDKRGKVLEQTNLGATHLDGSTTGQLLRQTYDAWGNTLSVTSSRGATTNYRYNAANQVVEEAKPTHTYYQDYAAGGSAVSGRPVTKTFYDAWGRAVASTDARGATATNAYLVTGELQAENHADGGTVTHLYDNFGRELHRYSATANAGQANARVYHYTWDKLGHMLSQTVDGRLLKQLDGSATSFASFSYVTATYSLGSYTYDELGNRISATSGDDAALKGVQQKYYFDGADRLIKSSDPLKTTTYEYDAAGHKTAEIDALGQRSSWAYKANGQLDSHLDIGGANTVYEYNFAGELTRQSNGRGQDLRTTYYDDGRVKTTSDIWGNSLSTYDYDADGNKTIDRFVTNASGSPTSYRNVTMSYDVLGRMSTLGEPSYQLSFQYDANGNRYRVQGRYDDNDYSPYASGVDIESGDTDNLSERKVDLTYTYDAANRVSGVRTLDYTGHVSAPVEAYRWEYFGYDKDGNRTSDEKRFLTTGTAGEVTARLVDYTYDFANRVSEVFVTSKTANGSGGDNIGTKRDHRKNLRNSLSGFTQEWQWANGSAADSFSYVDAAPDRIFTTENWSNASGNVTQVVSRQKLNTGNWYLSANQTSAYDAVGNLKSMHVDGYQDQSTSLASNLDYRYTYLKMDGYLQRSGTVTGTQWNGASMVSVGSVTTTQDYDVNGRLTGTFDNNAANTSGEQYLVNDHAGHIVLKVRGRAAVALGAHVQTGTWDPTSSLHGSAGGSSVPTRATTPSLDATITSSVSLQRLRYANDQSIGATSENYSLRFMRTRDVSGYFERYSVSNTFEDGFGASAVNASASSGTQYTWRTGDTLRGVAQTFYGDANLWYVIAEANGYNDEALPQAGEVLRLPSVTRASNTASTFAVYDPGKIVGSTNPEAIAPPPPPQASGGCGGLGMILVIVVAIVATVVTAGAAAVAMGAAASGAGAATAAGVAAAAGGGLSGMMAAGAAALGGTFGFSAAALGAAAIGGAVGSIASQGAAMAMGMQDSFSWKQVGLGAVGAGVTAGLGAAGVIGDTLAGSKYLATAARAGISSALTQGVAVATGLQDQFSWRSVAASAIAAPVAQAVGGQIFGEAKGGAPMDFGEKLGRNLVSGLVSQSVRMLVTRQGKVDYASIAADAFGNVLGEQLAQSSQSNGAVFNIDEADMDAGAHVRAAEISAAWDSHVARVTNGSLPPPDNATDAELVAYRLGQAGYAGGLIQTGGTLASRARNEAQPDLRTLIDRANFMPWQSGLTREDVNSTSRALAEALKNIEDPAVRNNIIGAQRSIAEAAGFSGIWTTDEVLAAPGTVDAVIESGAMGGSNADVPASIGRRISSGGISVKSDARAMVRGLPAPANEPDADFVGPIKSGFSPEEVKYYRGKTPSQAIRNMVNPDGPKIDPIYKYPVDRLEADHMVSFNEIIQMPRISELPPSAVIEILNLPDNFVGLGKSTNASKQDKSFANYSGHSRLGPVDPVTKADFVNREMKSRIALENALNTQLQKKYGPK